MIDLKNVITDFQKTNAYAVLNDIIRMCGVDSVLCALSEITAAKQSVQPDGCPVCHGEKGAFLDGHWTECIACYGNC